MHSLNLVSLQVVASFKQADGRRRDRESGMFHERLTTIWSLYQRAEKTFRVGYFKQTVDGCRVFELEWIQELRD
jgi:hypothetical protein